VRIYCGINYLQTFKAGNENRINGCVSSEIESGKFLTDLNYIILLSVWCFILGVRHPWMTYTYALFIHTSYVRRLGNDIGSQLSLMCGINIGLEYKETQEIQYIFTELGNWFRSVWNCNLFFISLSPQLVTDQVYKRPGLDALHWCDNLYMWSPNIHIGPVRPRIDLSGEKMIATQIYNIYIMAHCHRRLFTPRLRWRLPCQCACVCFTVCRYRLDSFDTHDQCKPAIQWSAY
jgi:hypothetical protein